MVLQAKLDGLATAVVRIGNLCNRYSDLVFQRNHKENATLTKLKAFIDLGLFPEEMAGFALEFSPVDYTSKAIIKLAQHYNNNYSVFHAYNPKAVRFADVARMAGAAALKIKPVPVEHFIREVQNTVQQPEIAYIHEAFIHDIGSDGRIAFQSNISLNNDFTTQFLRETGFEWCDIGGAYLEEYIKYFNKIGYWEAAK